MKKYLLPIALLGMCAITACAQNTNSPTAELLKNPSFEEEVKPIRNRRFGPNGEGELFGARLPEGIIPGWIIPRDKAEASTIETTAENVLPEHGQKALCWHITDATASIANVGDHGIRVVKGCTYTLTFWARATERYKGKVSVGLQGKDAEATWCAEAKVKGKIKKRWKRYTIALTATEDVPNARLVITATKPGTLYLDCASLTTE